MMGSGRQGVPICFTTLRAFALRLWTLNEIVLPIVPTGTIRFTRAGEICQCARPPSGCCFQAALPAEPELGFVTPHAVENDSELASNGNTSASHAARLGNRRATRTT